jgi:hypothetical protein
LAAIRAIRCVANLGHVVVQVVVSIEQLVLGAKGDLAEQQDADVV